MAIHIVRLGTPRSAGEGLRVGTVRHLPRGVRKSDYAKRDYFDTWLPELAPSAKLVHAAMSKPPMDEARWRRFERSYRAEMKKPDKARLLDVFARLSEGTDFAVGCYCEDYSRCHRSLLAELFRERGAKVVVES